MDKNTKAKIKDLMNKIVNYTNSETIKPILLDYIKEVRSHYNDSDELSTNIDSLLTSFMFEYEIEDHMQYLDFFVEGNNNLTQEEIKAVLKFKNNLTSFFYIKTIGKDFFELYSLLNERTYIVKPLDNFLNYKSIKVGNYLNTRIFPYEDAHFFYGEFQEFASSAKKFILQITAMLQTQEPSLLVKDNPIKLQKIMENNLKAYHNFVELFHSDVIFTCGKSLDTILEAFNSFKDNKIQPKASLNDLLAKSEKFYFDSAILEEAKNQNSPEYMMNMYIGCHDIGITFDKYTGLNVLPYYGTFIEIFVNPNYKEIQDYENCIMYYFEEELIPPDPIVKVVKEFPENARVILSELFEIEDFSIAEDFDELIHEYKYDYYENNRVSVNTIFQESNTFKEFLKVLAQEEEASDNGQDIIEDVNYNNIGRNEPCPCGSGKKFKKCCKTLIN